MQTYTIRPGGVAAMQQRALWQNALLYGLFGLLLLSFMNRGDFSGPGLVGLTAGSITMVLLFSFLIWSGIRSLPKEWNSYALLVGGDTVTRQHQRLGEVTIRRAEVTQIEDYPETGLMLKTADRKTTIFVPTDLEDYATVRAQLATWMAFTPKLGPWGLVGRYALIFSIPTLLFAIMFLVDSVPAIAISWAGMVGLLAWSLYHMQRQKLLHGWFLAFMLFGCVMMVFVLFVRVMRVMAM